jgi:DNA-binding CsgD family transcriptional regulator
VEVLGRYSNLCDQGEHLRHLLEIVPEGPGSVNVRTSKQVQNRLDGPQAHRLRQAYKSGATLKELARDFHVNRRTAADLLERGGIPRRGKGPSDSEVQQAIRLYGEGKSTAIIAHSLGFSAETIRNHLLAAGVVIRDPHHWHRRHP